jgi:hypothetical protein
VPTEDLWEMRCRVCGTLTGYHHNAKRLVTWCSPECEALPYSKYDNTIERDEVACELFLAGMPVNSLGRELGISHQLLAHVLQQRGVFASDREAQVA